MGFPRVWYALWITSQLCNECRNQQDISVNLDNSETLVHRHVQWAQVKLQEPLPAPHNAADLPRVPWQPSLSPKLYLHSSCLGQFREEKPSCLCLVETGNNEKGCRGRVVCNSNKTKEEMLM